MLIIGIDPGTATTGYGLVRETDNGIEVVDFGVVVTPAGERPEIRLFQIYDELTKLMLLHRPQSGAVERLFFQRNVSTAIAVGQARGVAMLVMAQNSVPVSEYTPLEVKQAVTGYGKADKNQVQQMVKALLELEDIPRPDDAADALAIAICHLHSMKYSSLSA
ncbi:MAG: crossover junction endodeoxyribonuclease RuvC [Bellilinea sp.]